MFFVNKRKQPLYKKLITVRKNIINKKKLFRLNKRKWDRFKMYLNKQSRRKRKIRKPYTIHEFHIPRFASLGNSFKKKFRNDLQNKKKFKLFYGGLRRKFLKKQTKQILKKTFVDANINLLEIFERRLDSVLFRSRFSSTITNAQQMILHGYVRVNKIIIKKKSYSLKQGDLIEINEIYSNLVKSNIKKIVSKLWILTIPPNYLIIKYKTLQIIFGNIKSFNFSNNFLFSLNTNSILINYNKH